MAQAVQLRRLTLRALFWVTGLLAFLLSSLLDNLTTALVMGTVAITVGRGHPRFVGLACINVVVAANAGGAFSPFGDITTLMVWQAGRAEFWDFFRLFVPSAVNWLVPALLMSTAVPDGRPAVDERRVSLRRGAWGVVAIFGMTIAMAVCAYNLLRLPPVLGMITGLGVLKGYAWWLALRGRRRHTAPPLRREPVHLAVEPPRRVPAAEPVLVGAGAQDGSAHGFGGPAFDFAKAPSGPLPPRDGDPPPASAARDAEQDGFDIFEVLRRSEWDTLLFFYGIILSVGGLAQIGYLSGLSRLLYDGLGPTTANVGVGVLSAVVDNIPVMFAVLNMNPAMDLSQWLLVTLTAGVGGSLLSIGSAAGVALMGQARGVYTFGLHLRWTWAIALGYAASIWVHLLVNR